MEYFQNVIEQKQKQKKNQSAIYLSMNFYFSASNV